MGFVLRHEGRNGYAWALRGLGKILARKGRLSESSEMFAEAVNLLTNTHGKTYWYVAIFLNEWAELLDKLSQAAMASLQREEESSLLNNAIRLNRAAFTLSDTSIIPQPTST